MRGEQRQKQKVRRGAQGKNLRRKENLACVPAVLQSVAGQRLVKRRS